MKKYILAFMLLGILSSCNFAVEEKTDIPDKSFNIPVIEQEETKENEEMLQNVPEENTENINSIPEYLDIVKNGKDLVFENILTENNIYTRYQISYTSDDYTISGIMNIPKDTANAPLIILNHGYIDPSVYTLGRGLKREQDYFARNGFAVLHTDYRNHAFSDVDESLSGTGMILRSKKYGTDAINAILAVQQARANGASELKNVNSESVGMLGHSMGGGVTMYSLVAASELIDAAVLYAPVHSNEYYNYERWSSKRLSTDEKDILSSQFGNLESPETFIPISPEGYFENISAPAQIYFGTLDESCPVAWGTDIKNALENENKSVELIMYEGEKHEFIPRWTEFMESSTVFFEENL